MLGSGFDRTLYPPASQPCCAAPHVSARRSGACSSTPGSSSSLAASEPHNQLQRSRGGRHEGERLLEKLLQLRAETALRGRPRVGHDEGRPEQPQHANVLAEALDQQRPQQCARSGQRIGDRRQQAQRLEATVEHRGQPAADLGGELDVEQRRAARLTQHGGQRVAGGVHHRAHGRVADVAEESRGCDGHGCAQQPIEAQRAE
eukprot:scaffold103383_cov63-Phaeocystis_antarctica.AAC.5